MSSQPIPINQVLAKYGITTKSFVIYNDPFDGFDSSPFASQTAALQYYASQGFRIYACVDCSNGLSYYTDLYAACKAAGIVMTAPLYLWGYETQFYFNTNGYLTLPDPDEQEYYLQGMNAPGGTTATTKPPLYAPYSLIPALAFKTYPGMSIDAPALLTAFQQFYAQLNSAIGLKNMIGISGSLEADHPVNYMGAQGLMGGNNMNSYARYVNSPLGFYQGDVSAGDHLSDGTPCLLWPLVGHAANYTGAASVPSVPMAVDVYNYHHYTSSPEGTVTNVTSSYAKYGAASNALLEEGIFQYFQSFNPYSFWRTAIPTAILNSYVSNWTDYLTYQGTSSPGAAVAFMQQYPGQIMLPFFNYSNCDDNSSNQISGSGDLACPGGCSGPPLTAGYGIASPATVLAFFNSWIPQLANYVPFMEADNQPCTMQSQATATAWGTLGPQYASIPLASVGQATTIQVKVVPSA